VPAPEANSNCTRPLLALLAAAAPASVPPTVDVVGMSRLMVWLLKDQKTRARARACIRVRDRRKSHFVLALRRFFGLLFRPAL
jgi:hypothetical protein